MKDGSSSRIKRSSSRMEEHTEEVQYSRPLFEASAVCGYSAVAPNGRMREMNLLAAGDGLVDIAASCRTINVKHRRGHLLVLVEKRRSVPTSKQAQNATGGVRLYYTP